MQPRGRGRGDAAGLRLSDGPLALLDLIGLDTAYEILARVQQAATGCTRRADP